MKKRLFSFFIGGERFKNEFTHQLRTLILITLGFTIAFTWRQTIFDLTEAFVKFCINVKGAAYLSLLTSITVTIFSILLMIIFSFLLKDSSHKDH
jgi:uncharacterized protein involved in cysteine biosynthesis